MRRLRGALLDPPPPGALVGIAWRPHQKLTARDDFLAILRESVTLIDERHALPFARPGARYPAAISTPTPLKRTARALGSAAGGP
jgi:hypothetical protein